MGRKAIQLTDEQKLKLQEFAGLGFTLDSIASYLDIGIATLCRMKEEGDIEIIYKKAKDDAVGKVAKSLFNQATDPEEPNTTAAIFYLKTQGRWSTDYEKAITEAVTNDRGRWMAMLQRVLPPEMLKLIAPAMQKEFGS